MPIGNDPIATEKLILTSGADFTYRANAAAGETIPTSTTAMIGFYPDQDTGTTPIALWPATAVTGAYIEWLVQSDEADDIPGDAFFRLYVVYPETPTLEHCWYRGKVARKQ
jgi:hypothetical protein